MFTKKAQTGGLITGLVFGIASLVIGVIIALVITSTLSDANLLEGNRGTTTVINESGSLTVYINGTGYNLTGFDEKFIPGTVVITEAWNETAVGGISLITSTNYTVSSTGVITNATAASTYPNASISYTGTTYSDEELVEGRLSANFTKGVDNVSGKIPTVLLVAAIVLILGVLALLVATWQRMRIGGGGI